jgi:hypothetical protein
LKREREKVLKKERKKKEKLEESLQIKWENQYFERRKTFEPQNLFT